MAQGVEMPPLDAGLLRRWISAVAADHDREAAELTYIFCDDATILDVNRRFLQHDYYTDIITFDYTRGRRLRGDIYLSLDTVASNARMLGVDYERELHRVIIHGVLHLCGIDDKAPGQRQIMESHEDKALEILSQLTDNQDNNPI
ncbi:MAG: rRNA maturation RNase YbeY [Muribaculaceae bacterium]|nr:rRNA maturation RNase YbeY [Muribaculaceae bacterium]MDE6322051.1 rRNA maturation RNase YbeY [Muribaculaceae bacterium]